MKFRDFTAVLALSALVSVAACSGGQQEAATQPAPAPAAAPTPPPAPPPSNPQDNQADHDLVRQVQTTLKQNHMYRGRVDGAWGRMTERAVRQFQQKNGLQATGQLDDATLKAMNLQPASSSSGGASSSMPSGGSTGTGTGGSDMTAPAPATQQ